MPDSARATRKRAATSSHDGSSVWRRVGRSTLLVLVFTLPWFFLPMTAAPAPMARTLVAAILGTIGLVALLAETVERRRLAYPSSWASVGVLAIVVATAISTLFSAAPGLSVFGNLIAPDALLHVLIGAVVFVLAAVFVTEKGDYVRLLAAFVTGAGVASLLAILGMLGVPHLAAYAPTTVAELGFIAVLALGTACLVPLKALETKAQALLLGSGVLSLAILVLMNFRILWVAVALIALFSAATGFMRRVSIGIPLGLSLIALVFVLVGPRLPTFTVSSLELRPGTGLTVAAAKQTLSGKHALIGTGPDTYAYAMATSRTAESNASPFWNTRFDQGVSYLATIPTTLGILGSLAWLLALLGGIMLAWRRMDDPVAPYAILVAGLAGVGLLVYPGSFMEIVFGALGLGLLVGISGKRREISFPAHASWPLFATFLVLIVVTAGSLAGLYLVGERYAAAAYFAAGGNAIAAGNTDQGLHDVGRAVDLDGSSDAFQRGLSQALLASFRAKTANTTTTPDQQQQQQFQAMLQAALASAQQATMLNPADALNWANLGGIYEGLVPYLEGSSDKALEAYSHAEDRDPMSPAWPLAKARVYSALAQTLTQKGQPAGPVFTQGQEQIDAALKLKNDFADARFLSAQMYLVAGDHDNAIKRVQELRSINGNDVNLAFQIGLLLYQNNLFSDARADFEHALALNEAFSNARYFLGLTYSQLGMHDQAVAEFQRLSKDNPDNKEVQQIISNLGSGRPILEGISQQPQATSTASTTTQ